MSYSHGQMTISMENIVASLQGTLKVEVLSAVVPLLIFLSMGLIGLVLAHPKYQLVPRATFTFLSKLVFVIFLPCLIFTYLGPTITLKNLLLWWFIPVNVVLSTAIGCALGLLVALICRPPRDYFRFTIIMTAFGNTGNLPLAIVTSICQSDDNPFGSDCYDYGVSYVSFSQWVSVILVYTLVYHMMEPPLRDQSLLVEEEEDDEGEIFEDIISDPNYENENHLSRPLLVEAEWPGIEDNETEHCKTPFIARLFNTRSSSARLSVSTIPDVNGLIEEEGTSNSKCLAEPRMVVDLCTNRFHGELITPFTKMANLRKLYLCENYVFGEMPEEIGNLALIEELVIYSNNLTGSIPGSISKLKRLEVLRAGRNSLSGPIPTGISECESLEVLGLSQNHLEGSIPRELEKLQNLTDLILWQNHLTGSVPPEIGNLSSLELLALHQNSLGGMIPKELGKLAQLKKLYIYTNQLNGTIPSELGNCTNAVHIDFSENQLTGVIPRELGYIPNLVLLHLFENHLEGNIPRELGELRQLQMLDLSINNLTGTIPLEFQNLTYMDELQLFDNHLEGKIPPLLGANSNLSILDMSANKLEGSIPAHLCKYGKLAFLSLGSNRLSGNIPYGIKTCKSLVQLMLGDNHLTGSLPMELYTLSALEVFQNRFSGPIPPEIGRFRSLERLLLSDNYFIGYIPPVIGNLSQLVTFNLSSNRLTGSIPRELGNCTKLQRLDLSRNYFTGVLPEELGKLVNLELLKLSDNKLMGGIPSSLGDLVRLTELQMGGNHLSGNIPFQLGQLSALQIALNISHNNLSGEIPEKLGDLQMLISLYLNDNQLVGEIPTSIGELLSLLVCNLSNNNLVGTVPNTQVFRRMDSSNFAGNNGLCRSGSYHCHQSAVQSNTSKRSWIKEGSSKEKLVSIIAAVIGFISLILIVGFCWAMKRTRPTFVPLEDPIKPDVLDNYYFPKEGFKYQDLVVATNNFSDNAVLGRGACGTVYKAVMADGQVIAVKKLRAQGEGVGVDSSFRAEISTLGNISHCNIVKLYGFCCHQDSNLLLYEYMENGSLGEHLHGNDQRCFLDWNTRYKIALGAAEGLCYLHYYCKPQIVHRDIKSNNILLDEVLEAHVGDFGLAKLIELPYSKSMSAVAGSYGYIAPEYAYTMKVTEKCDIYSFGVVLLELVTGKTPVQPLEQGGDLVTLVRRTINNSVATSELFDKRLDMSEKGTTEEMTLFLKIALFCTSVSPVKRPTMREVIAMMIDARRSVTVSSCSSPTSESPLDEGPSRG